MYETNKLKFFSREVLWFCTIIIINICKETGVQLDKKHWYERVQKSVETIQGSKVTILWNQQVQTDRTIPNNKLNVIFRGNEKGTYMLIDVVISGDRNVIEKEADKILKYKDLTIEIQRMWNVKTEVIPVIIGATGTISKSIRKYVSNIPGKHEVKELQKTAIMGTANILREVKGNGKAVPSQAWSGPEVSKKLRLPDFMTTAQDGGKVVSLTRRPLLPSGNAPGTHFC